MKELEKQIRLWHQENEASRKLEAIPGIGPITASAIVGDAREFKNGRQMAAWVGLVPQAALQRRQANPAGYQQARRHHLRTLLIHGARAVTRFAEKKSEPDSWIRTTI